LDVQNQKPPVNAAKQARLQMETDATEKRDAAKTPRISGAALIEVENAMRDYAKEVLKAGLGKFATNIYIDKADQFVRWLKHDFTPGERLRG
jgi:hypothetical protein